MKGTTLILALTATLPWALAVPLEAPLPGHAVSPPWALDGPSSPGRRPLILLNETAATGGSHGHVSDFPEPSDFPGPVKGNCRLPGPKADSRKILRNAIPDMLYKRGRPRLGPGPNKCARVSCSHNSAIWWCNDTRRAMTLKSFLQIALAAKAIVTTCSYEEGTHHISSQL